MRARMVVLVLLLVAACDPISGDLPKVKGPDGRTWWELSCPSNLECREQLSTYCPHGYQTRDEAVEDEGTRAATFGNLTFVKSSRAISMLFRCNNDK